ncbi:hypothetical protein ACNVED_04385 [Legionella sp. D16C41]|uniref:hypothetical protein n=1 Tax=Legionella sp. D16C41 TaxID=3402688 RepID=UPI003AF915AF
MLTQKDAKKLIKSAYEGLHGFFSATSTESSQSEDVALSTQIHPVQSEQSQSAKLNELQQTSIEQLAFIEKGVEYLEALRDKLYIYHFEKHPFYERIEVGINHIVIYPHPTQAGRKLLACMVATMWDKRNYDYFNVYKDLLEPGTEQGVEFVLDHAGNKYSNPVFNSSLNSAAEHPHFHPVKSGGYHTHYSYGWQFSGLMAVHSILALGEVFLEESEPKDLFKQETVACLEHFSRYIATILLATLPFDKLQNEKVMQDLKLTLDFIYNNNLFKLVDSKFLDHIKSMQITSQTIQLIRRNYTAIKHDDLTNILRIFIYDLKHFANNFEHMLKVEFTSTASLYRFGDQQSIEELFRLACCLHHPDTSIEFIDYDMLKEKLDSLDQQSNSVQKQQEVEFILNELNLRELRHQAHLDNKEQLKQLRLEFYKLLNSNGSSVADYTEVDEELVGFRERVAARLHNSSLAFTSAEIKEDKEHVKNVSRPNTHNALAEITKKHRKNQRDQIAAKLFLETVLYVSAESVKQGELNSNIWLTLYDEIIHLTSLINEPLKTTCKIHSVLEPNAKLNFSLILPSITIVKDIMELDGGSNHPNEPIDDNLVPELKIAARWVPAKESVLSPFNPNKTCKLDTFQILSDIEEIDFPVVDPRTVSKALLTTYGVSLHSISEELNHQDNVTLYATEYEFNENYLKNYILNEKCGGGLPIQMKNFRHYFIPMESSCRGGLIIGRQVEQDEWSFIALEVPYGYVLQIEPGVIHSDAFCKGRYTITLAAPTEENIALIKKNCDAIQLVNQHLAEIDNVSKLLSTSRN